MKRARIVTAVLLLLLAAAAGASAVELEAGPVRAYGDNILAVTSEEGGRLTIEAWNGTLPLENPVTDLKIEAGRVEIPWNGLSRGGEPVPAGKIRLRATLACWDRTTEQAETTVNAETPLTAAVCCLPSAQCFYPDGKNALKIEIALSAAGSWEASAAPKGHPEDIVWREKGRSDGREPVALRWSGMRRAGVKCEPGEYIISARTKACPERVQTAEVTILAEPLPEPALEVTGSLMPADFTDDAEVWKALTAPAVVGDGAEGSGLRIMGEKGARTGYAGTVSCRTAGVAVLEICEDGWVRVGAWTQQEGRYTEGWVKAEKLKVVRPNGRYGAVVDKKAQTMTVYGDGRKIGTVKVSTGHTTAEDRSADTHSGVYLMATRMEAFSQDGHIYCYPVRIDGKNLIHSSGFALENGLRDYEEERALLGTNASHGCIRVDPAATEENGGLNAWWVWTHLGRDTKIIVTPEE